MKGKIKTKIKRKIGALVVVGMFVLIGIAMPVAGDTCDVWVRDDVDTCIYPEVIGDELGIGATDPDFKLEVTGSSGSGYFGVTSSSDGDIFIIDSSGDVGIGDTTPSHQLEILDISTTANRAGLYVAQTGVISGTGYGSYITKTGASTTNVGGYFFANGATNNYGLIVAGGDVGIGTLGPSHKLEIDDISTTANRAGLYISQSGDTSGTGYGCYITKTGASTTNVGGYFSASQATNNYGLLVANGDVGIGDTSPDFKLEIDGSSGSGYFGVTTSSNGDIFKIDSTGKVGIGTASPQSKLTVAGGVTIGSGWAASYGASSTGLLVEGSVGIGATSPGAKLDVEVGSGGAATIGNSWCAATGDLAVAMGDSTEASGAYSVAIGEETVAEGTHSHATGWDTEAIGPVSTTMGFKTKASGWASVAIGQYVSATNSYSYVIGQGQDSNNYLVNNIENSFMVGFESTTPTLFVDGSSVGIGTTSPNSILEIADSSQNTWITMDEADANPTSTQLDQDDSISIYNKADKLVFAYNNGGTITYISLDLDGSDTTWTHSTTAP